MRNKKAWIFWESRRKYWDYSVISLCVYGNPGKKTARRIELEKGLLNWLRQRSLAQIFDWFDCLEETTVKTGAGVRRWTTESVARDRLFLELLGVAKS